MDANERMPGDAEAAAAAEGMQELYGRPAEHAVGDTVTFQLTGWATPKQGQIDAISGGRCGGCCEYLIRSGDRTWLVMDTEILSV